MRSVLLASLGVFAWLAGVAAQERAAPAAPARQAAAAQEQAEPVQPRPIGSVVQLMDAILFPASNIIWEAIKIEINEKGWEEIYPKTDEEWAAVLRSSIVLAEAGNLLMLHGRPGAREREAGWIAMARQLTDGGELAIKASLAKDPKLFSEASETIRFACSRCHIEYAPRRQGYEDQTIPLIR
jgi:hypothetical protein